MESVHTLSALPPWMFFAVLAFVALAAIFAKESPWNIDRPSLTTGPTEAGPANAVCVR